MTRRARPHPGDGGFSVVELVVAMVVILTVAVSSMTALVRTSSSLNVSRQREAASALATQALEQLRALPYAKVTAGLRSDDLAGDADLRTVSGGYNLYLPASVTGAGTVDEPLVASGTGSVPAPLYPHRSTPTTAGGLPSSFTSPPSLSVFVTKDPADSGAYTLTAVVRWTPGAGATQKVLVQRSLVYSPPGSGGA